MSEPRYRDDDDEIEDKTVDVIVPDDTDRIVEIEILHYQSSPRVQRQNESTACAVLQWHCESAAPICWLNLERASRDTQ
jgi:hypothetical protein